MSKKRVVPFIYLCEAIYIILATLTILMLFTVITINVGKVHVPKKS